MFIKTLKIENVRNIQSLTLSTLSQVNVFTGDNGAGKTSILESLYIASVGRSFRHQQIKPLLNIEAHFLRVFLECIDSHGMVYKLGIERNHKSDYKIRINGEKATSLAALSRLLPLIIIDSTSFTLLDGASSDRRKFLDWGVFHVEHSFYDNWRLYSKAIKQRNTLLKQGNSNYSLIKPWDKQLVTYALAVESARQSYLAAFVESFNIILKELDENIQSQIAIVYKDGWGHKTNITDINAGFPTLTTTSLLAVLEANFIKDKKYQRTTEGSHRADLQLFVGKQLVKDIFSRGQKKTVVAALKLTQAELVYKAQQASPVILLDDMPSELDKEHLNSFFRYLHTKQYQLFITGVDVNIFSNLALNNPSMFHVEHGEINPL